MRELAAYALILLTLAALILSWSMARRTSLRSRVQAIYRIVP